MTGQPPGIDNSHRKQIQHLIVEEHRERKIFLCGMRAKEEIFPAPQGSIAIKNSHFYHLRSEKRQ